jgi:hypothetical protein
MGVIGFMYLMYCCCVIFCCRGRRRRGWGGGAVACQILLAVCGAGWYNGVQIKYTAEGEKVNELLTDDIYNFISQKDKDFIIAFNECMIKAGYENNGIQPYVVFGKYKIEYYKPGSKTKKYIARIYIRDNETVLRLYFSNIDKRRACIEKSPDFIKKPFVDDSHLCKPNCKGMITNGKCRYQKTYTLDGVPFVKCAEQSFMYYSMDANNASKYVELLAAFYPVKKQV